MLIGYDRGCLLVPVGARDDTSRPLDTSGRSPSPSFAAGAPPPSPSARSIGSIDICAACQAEGYGGGVFRDRDGPHRWLGSRLGATANTASARVPESTSGQTAGPQGRHRGQRAGHSHLRAGMSAHQVAQIVQDHPGWSMSWYELVWNRCIPASVLGVLSVQTSSAGFLFSLLR